MEQFVVSARKYRPASFDTVIGQDHITKTLQNAIERNQLAQALLFCGPRGVGKTTCARILAHTINEFDSSQELSQSMNVYELDAASNNSVDDIRNLIDQVRYPPQYGKYKVYIIDEVHMLSNAAFNAFLKTLEEPPSYAIFILATTEKHKVIPTILSRCQIYDFNRIGISDMVNHLKYVAEKEQVDAEDEALHLIAQKADGALRDALSFFDMIVTFASDNKVTLEATLHNLHVLDYEYYFRITEYLLQENTSDTLLTLDEILAKGFDSHNFINGLSEHLRNLMVCKDAATVELLEVSDSVKQRYLQQCQQTSLSFLMSALNVANLCDLSFKSSKNPRLHVEIALMKMAYLPAAIQLSAGTPKKKTTIPKGELKIQDKSSDARESSTKPLKKTAVLPKVQASPPPLATTSATIENGRKRVTGKLPNLHEIKNKLALATGEETPTATIKSQRAEAFTKEDLWKYWQEFAENRRQAGKQQEYLILSQKPAFEEPYTVKIKLSSAVQIDTVDNLKSDLMPFLRNKVQNDLLKLEAELEIDETKNLIYTPAEKFQYLVSKHPPLKALQEKLGLDPDF